MEFSTWQACFQFLPPKLYLDKAILRIFEPTRNLSLLHRLVDTYSVQALKARADGAGEGNKMTDQSIVRVRLLIRSFLSLFNQRKQH